MTRPRLTTRPFQPLLAALAVIGVVVLAISIAVDLRDVQDERLRTGWFLLALVLVAVLTGLLAREITARSRADRSFTIAGSALSELGDPIEDSLGERTVPEVADDLASRIRNVLQAEWGLVAFTDEGFGELTVTAADGPTPFTVGEDIPGDAVPPNTASDQLAVPISLANEQFGLIWVGGGSGRRFRRSDHELLRLLGDRAAVLLEQARLADVGRRSALGAAQARSHLALISELSIVLARSLEDPTPALREISKILIREFADACMVHLSTEGGRLELTAGAGRTPRADTMTTEPAATPPLETALRRVLASGRSELNFVANEGRLFGADDALAQTMRDAGMTSWVVAPIRMRGLPMGTLTIATGRSRRGFRPSDQAVIDEIAGRMAIAIERSVLYRDTRGAGVAAERRAGQLSNLLEAAIALTRSLQPSDVLDTLVAQAVQLLDATRAQAWLGDDSGVDAVAGEHVADPVRISGALVDHDGAAMGSLIVERDAARPFEADEEALLVLVTRFASSALQNARLFDAVRLREQRLAALFAASPLAILELDLGGTIRETNPAARAMFGANTDDDLVLPPALIATLSELREHALTGDIAHTEVSLSVELPDGRLQRLELWVSAAPLRRATGGLAGMLVVLSDTTERKRLEEQLIDAHRYEAIAQLAGGIAHDFNNLLTIIVGYSDMLLRDELHEKTQRDEIAAIHEAGRHAAVITNQLLTLSRRQVVQPVVLTLSEACKTLQSILQRLVGDRMHVQLKCEGDAAIRIDPGQLEQILFNLVLNSRDASEPGSPIVISTKARRKRRDGTQLVSLSVTDQGAGMSPETVARCLEPFFTTKGRRGIGLGLATVQSIVQRAGGTLEIKSEEGRGTTITALFPRVLETAEVPAPVRHDRAKVLLVDDDELIRRYVSQVLLDAGFDVTAVGTAEAAIEAIEELGDGTPSFDLLVSDIVLPGMNGFELARRARELRPDLARLLITGYAGTDTSGTDLEDVTVLPKPFAGDDLVRAANDALG